MMGIAVCTQGGPVGVGSMADQRGETATWFGAIRGGYGNPLKKLEATPSVSVVVQTDVGVFASVETLRLLAENPCVRW
jgi:hypothetical protein